MSWKEDTTKEKLQNARQNKDEVLRTKGNRIIQMTEKEGAGKEGKLERRKQTSSIRWV